MVVMPAKVLHKNEHAAAGQVQKANNSLSPSKINKILHILHKSAIKITFFR